MSVFGVGSGNYNRESGTLAYSILNRKCYDCGKQIPDANTSGLCILCGKIKRSIINELPPHLKEARLQCDKIKRHIRYRSKRNSGKWWEELKAYLRQKRKDDQEWRDRRQAYNRGWCRKHPDVVAERQKKYSAFRKVDPHTVERMHNYKVECRKQLRKGYIKNLITVRTGIKYKEIPDEFAEQYRMIEVVAREERDRIKMINDKMNNPVVDRS